MKNKTPDQFTEADLQEVHVMVISGGGGCYNGPDTPMSKVKAQAGPIHQYELTSSFHRLVHVLRGQDAGAYEQWLQAVWQTDIKQWTVDHPKF